MPDVWLPLPGKGKNKVMITRAVLPCADAGQIVDGYNFNELLFYDALGQAGLTLRFESEEFANMGPITLEFGDILVWCPMGHVRVYCAICRKFLWPAKRHRASNSHTRAMENAEAHSAPANYNSQHQ